MLAPGEVILVVSDRDAFVSRYGTQLRIAGEFAAGKLNNAGETIEVRTATGTPIQVFTYDDASPWPVAADGLGSSLEIVNPAGDYHDPANWRASTDAGGTPGRPAQVPGDVTGDGRVDSSDLVFLFQVGEYEDRLPGNSTFSEGDWNGDGDFTSSDLVFLFQRGPFFTP
jgi:hypothetical protein